MEMDASIDVTFPFERIYSRLFVPSGKDHVLVFLFGNLIFLDEGMLCIHWLCEKPKALAFLSLW